MIKNVEAYRKRAEGRRWQALRRMSPEDSIAIGEALLTSEVMAFVRSVRRGRTRCLAFALGISKPSGPQR